MRAYVVWGLLALVMLYELWASRNRRRSEAVKRDRGSFWVFQVLIGGGFWAGFRWAFSTGGWRPLGAWSLWVGTAVALGGLAVRVWAIRTLGRYFTRSVQVSTDQPVIESGPYRWVRHPSYTGLGFIVIGIGLALGNLGSLLLLVLPTVISGVYRVRVEEAALVEAIGAPYRAYMSRTHRFLPGLL